MKLETAITEINKFWKENNNLPFCRCDNNPHIERLNQEFSRSIPETLHEYVKFAPLTDFYFDTVGNPIRIYGIENLKYVQEGYNYNPLNKTKIDSWQDSYFIFADEGADPIIIDLNNLEKGIQKLEHGMGSWDYGETIADSFGQFLLCCAAQHHALNNFEEDSVIDDENGFNLSEKAAEWYFQNMKKWAGDFYEEWCSVFDNYLFIII